MAAVINIVDTSVANIASLQAAFRRLNRSTALTRDASIIRTAEHLVLPGVGSFGHAMDILNNEKLVAPLAERINHGLPTLAVCLGLQLLCRASEESPGIEGIGVIPVDVHRFPADVQVPQLGWNEVHFDAGFLPHGHAYFANSFRVTDRPEGWTVAMTNYGGEFVSSMTRGQVLACQFHPELSGAWGQQILQWWMDGCAFYGQCQSQENPAC